jgi:hypothetical protein
MPEISLCLFEGLLIAAGCQPGRSIARALVACQHDRRC